VPYSIITTAYARRDIQDAIDWENMRNPGLGQYFIKDLDSKIAAIANMPLISPIRYEYVRCAPTNIFSYLVHYVVDDDKKIVTIIRVLHTSRAPVW
jgi:plasmid stabilization system protein ParE